MKKKINRLQLKKSVVANLANTGMNGLAGGNDTTVVRTLLEISNPCSGRVACEPTAATCQPTNVIACLATPEPTGVLNTIGICG